MKCPNCKVANLLVDESRPTGNGVRRRRRCPGCGHKLSTREVPEDSDIVNTLMKTVMNLQKELKRAQDLVLTETHYCAGCKTQKPLTQFYVARGVRRRRLCIQCCIEKANTAQRRDHVTQTQAREVITSLRELLDCAHQGRCFCRTNAEDALSRNDYSDFKRCIECADLCPSEWFSARKGNRQVCLRCCRERDRVDAQKYRKKRAKGAS